MIVAHTSDWTGMVYVLAPLVFFAWLLHVAKRRAEAGPPPRPPQAGASGDPGHVHPDRP